ncbi:hypothetical protein [Hankyongella ginsenosidimutans]|nr:hypothetical protein [Hankyongella ginsenosidimutans]
MADVGHNGKGNNANRQIFGLEAAIIDDVREGLRGVFDGLDTG